METKHTAAALEYCGTYFAWRVSNERFGGGWFSCRADTEANARRIVACVNACEGLSTDELERFGLASAFGTELLEIEKQRDQLQAERDQLVAALGLARAYSAPDGDKYFSIMDKGDLATIDAAIAAAKGSQHTVSNLLTDAEVIAGLEEQRKELADMLREVLEGRPPNDLEPMLAGIPAERYYRARQVLERCAPQQEGGVAC